MVLGLVAYRVPRSGLGTRRLTGRSPANSCGTVLLPYPGFLTKDVPLSPLTGERGQPGGARDLGTRASDTAARALSGQSPRLADTSDARRNVKRCGKRGYSAAIRAARINSAPQWGCCTGSTGLAGFTQGA